jgi:hypothetical protein
MDNHSHFHRKKIDRSARDCLRRDTPPLELTQLWRKRHIAGKTIAAHRGYRLKHHVFRREFEQRVKQLAGLCAFALQKIVFPILSQLIAAVPPIDLCRTP